MFAYQWQRQRQRRRTACRKYFVLFSETMKLEEMVKNGGTKTTVFDCD